MKEDLNKKILSKGLTFDDVLVIPRFSDILPSNVCTKTRFSKNINLNIPFVSAAMDTVTESKMAIAIAQEGGIGVLHKNMTIDQQSNEVRKVKRSESGMILDPITVSPQANIREVLSTMKENKIGGIPVVNEKKKLVGIVTNRDLRFEKDMDLLVSDVMTKGSIITTQFTDLANAEKILQENKIEKLPVINSNNELVGLITFKDIIKNRMRPNACKDEYDRLRVAAAVGVTDDVFERVTSLVKASVDAIIIDTAHGHSKKVLHTLTKLKKLNKDVPICVGNIATGEAAKKFITNLYSVPTIRGLRYFGPSKMPLTGLIIHSMSIIASFKREKLSPTTV